MPDVMRYYVSIFEETSLGSLPVLEAAYRNANTCSGAGAHLYQGSCSSPQSTPLTALSFPLQYVSTMVDNLQRRKDQGGTIPALNTAIDDLNLTNEVASTTPANTIFDSVAALLTMVRVSSLLFCDEMYRVYTSLGYDGQRTGLCGSRTIVC